jgi:starch-binding outer membrane protein SusE/F
MKTISKFAFLSILLAAVLWSCSKDEKQIYFEGGTAPVLSANKAAISLSYLTADDEAVTFSWTNPGYSFTTGVSSQDVSYVLEIDTVGANFTNPNKKQLAISKDLTTTISVATFNDYLLNQLVLVPAMAHNLEIRVKSTLVNNSVPLYSNVMQFTVTPYTIPPKVAPPTDGTLWIVGSAVASGWSNPLPAPYDVSQKFTRVSETLYELTVPLLGSGNGYKLIQTNGVWGTQYHALDGAVVTGGDFEMKDSDPQFPAPAAAGTYKITVDFQRGKYFVEKV